MVEGVVEVMIRFLKDTWKGIVYLFVLVFLVAVCSLIFKLWQLSLAFIGITLAIVLAMLFGIPKWLKVLAIASCAIALLIIDGIQNFLILLLLIFIYNRLFRR
ncbi:MAG: hypothetical protein WA093_05160 [Minisyncoccales bacterium]